MSTESAGSRMTTLEALAAKKTGPMPTGKSWKGLPVPFFFQEASAEAFGALEMKPDDVVCSSPVKAGTSWLHKIMILMLHGIDDDGKPLEPSNEAIQSLMKGQIYPDALPMERPAEPGFMNEKCICFPTLAEMPSPRLFTTHFFGDYLPKQLMDPDGKGRLVVCLRNPKDVLTSLHFFRGEAKDGWLGNEHGPGSLARFCSPNTPNAYGNVFRWMLETERTIAPLVASGRCHVVYFEDLKADLPMQLERLAAFLGVPLPAAKRDALASAVSLSAMSGHITVRKGEICDWKNHLSDAEWKLVDDTIAETIASSQLYQPLAQYAQR